MKNLLAAFAVTFAILLSACSGGADDNDHPQDMEHSGHDHDGHDHDGHDHDHDDHDGHDHDHDHDHQQEEFDADSTNTDGGDGASMEETDTQGAEG